MCGQSLEWAGGHDRWRHVQCCTAVLGEMKRAESVSAMREDVFHAAYAYSPQEPRSVEPGVREPAHLLLECSSLRVVNN